ncbi:DEAD/DEAH box helicase family protein [Bradyrhizobium manausense]|uniref:DEAD/DEAH box helicase family protein n=1 Tax=Bradyrhizobium manausense TaxID=989370 RepID=UPI001BA87CEF|nr:DEAD/DEAH box helicase family protein [Bradyrhizobium manausense]MBR0833186.1 DEAD/DEAH box helicase family protein [Bradyrhizobium manausense]
MELLDFQQAASDQIADRFVEYAESPVRVGRKGSERQIPFLQLLNSITASGKTLVLADSVSAIAKRLPVKPVVLWLSKASVVVAQSYAALDAGGTYHDLLEDFDVFTLADYSESELRNRHNSLLYFATVGTFNQEKKEGGTLNVFKSAIDEAQTSTWESLKIRPDVNAFRRPLIVVYDEAHNLSDNQVRLLLELEPDGFLLATATSRLPELLESGVIDHLKKIGGLQDTDLQTQVSAADVAASGLIKSHINLIGRQSPMEDVVNELLDDMKLASSAAKSQGLSGLPKAVYVCKTNITQDSGERDDPKQPFSQRRAPPILIWRHLTEKLKVRPGDIAVYCDLKVDRQSPLPEEFVLFRGGDKDYDLFVNGGFRHIIFNQSLQEGWDDPFVYFAYIDKSMGSKVQAEQIIGRLLRQPGRKHFKNQRLNTAQLYVRVEAAGVFEEVVRSVEQRISTGKLDIKITATRPGKKIQIEYPPKKKMEVPVAALITDRAEKKIEDYIRNMSDYRSDDGTNVRGIGKRVQVQRIVGGPHSQSFVWEDCGDSVSVLARWLFSREVARIHRGALGVAITSSSDGSLSKFDARIGLGSPAAVHIADVAKKVGEAFVDQVYLKLRSINSFEIGPVLIVPDSEQSFKYAIHNAYDKNDFNAFELDFAEALDKARLVWSRNQARSGYSIPLPTPGKTLNFYPDFLVWNGGNVFAIDTKGSHLHADAARKLVSIKPASDATKRVFVRFVSNGVVDALGPQPDSSGYTVWTFKPSGDPEFTHCETLAASVERCLEVDI